MLVAREMKDMMTCKEKATELAEWYDPECLHTVDEAIEYINEVGFLPGERKEPVKKLQKGKVL